MALIAIEERRVQPTRPSIQGTYAIFGRRAFSWSGVWAGAVEALGLQLMCSLAVDPRLYLLGGQTPAAGISILAGIWYLIYMGGSLYIAGTIAGQTGGDLGNRVLHGFTAWALCSVLGFNALAVWGSQINLGTVTSLATEWQLQGMIAQGWMLAGLIVGMVAALAGAIRIDPAVS